jgi:hypothetical protein
LTDFRFAGWSPFRRLPKGDFVDDLQYPIGRFKRPAQFTSAEREEAIGAIEQAPARLRAAILGLSDEQLDTPYRPGGWTVRQVVHHLPDSHLNAYVRCKLALTEDDPTIRPYEEARWAELEEARTAPIEVSLLLLEGLHSRWVMTFRNLQPEDWNRTFIHPVSGSQSLDSTAGLYAWHGKHHVAHINSLRQREGWL